MYFIPFYSQVIFHCMNIKHFVYSLTSLMDIRLFPLFKNLFIYLFLERGREGQRKGEKHQCMVASHVPPTGTWPATQKCALTGNLTGDPLVQRSVLNLLSHISQCCFNFLPIINNADMDTHVQFYEKCFNLS